MPVWLLVVFSENEWQMSSCFREWHRREDHPGNAARLRFFVSRNILPFLANLGALSALLISAEGLYSDFRTPRKCKR